MFSRIVASLIMVAVVFAVLAGPVMLGLFGYLVWDLVIAICLVIVTDRRQALASGFYKKG